MAEPTEEQVIVDEGAEVEVPEETTEEVVESEEEQLDTEGEEEEAEDEEVKPPSRRETLRIQQLLAKYPLKEKDESQTRTKPEGLDYKKAFDIDSDETVSQLENDRRKYGESQYNEGLEQAKSIEFRTNLRIDAPKMEALYPVLDKKSEKFNPVITDALNQMYLKEVGFDAKTGRVKTSDLTYEDFIESQMELAEEIANEKVARTKVNIAKQSAQTGLRPTGGTAKRLNLNQAPGAMSDEELDAVIAQAIPTRK